MIGEPNNNSKLKYIGKTVLKKTDFNLSGDLYIGVEDNATTKLTTDEKAILTAAGCFFIQIYAVNRAGNLILLPCVFSGLSGEWSCRQVYSGAYGGVFKSHTNTFGLYVEIDKAIIDALSSSYSDAIVEARYYAII